jgi:hypothetical protein
MADYNANITLKTMNSQASKTEKPALAIEMRAEFPATEPPKFPMSVDKLKLCYIKGNWAYFTTRAVEDQWGDYWNDTPYEHNAGEPYRFCEHDKKDGVIPWEIVKVAWEGDFDTPCDNHWNSPWSVELINRGEIYWLRISDCRTPIQGVAMGVFAGASLQEFRDFVHDNGGVVYEALGAK